MGRSVSIPRNTIVVCYKDVSMFGVSNWCYECELETDGPGHPCTGRGEVCDECDQDQARFDWEWFIEDIQERATDQWSSLSKCDEWIEREDHAILENKFCYIGVSEYCGLASIWIAVKQDDCYYDMAVSNFAEHWCRQIEPKFRELFGELRKVDTFSNGEAVFERVQP